MRLLAVSAIAAVLSAPLVTSACADSDPSTAPGDDGGDSPSPLEGGAPDTSRGDVGDARTPLNRICTDDDWCHTELPPKQNVTRIWGDEQGIVWAVTQEGSILRWDTKSWSLHFSTPSEPGGWLTAIWGSAPNEVWAGGASGLWRGDGTTWTAADLGEDGKGTDIRDIVGTPGGGVWAVGASAARTPIAFHRPSPSAPWERVRIEALETHEHAASFFELRRVWVAANGDIWLSGRAQLGWRQHDCLFRRPAAAPSNWVVVPLPSALLDPDANDFQFTAVGVVDRDAWLVGTTDAFGASYWVAKADAVAEPSDWKIARWKNLLDGERDDIRRTSVWGLSANDLWTSGWYGRVQHWDGITWTTARVSIDGIPIGDELSMLWGRSNDDLWAVGGPRALHRVPRSEAARLDAEHSRKDGGP